MKTSKYTFFINYYDKEFFIYNTLSNALLEIEKELYQILEESKKLDNDIDSSVIDKELMDVLKTRDFITENDIDNFLKYKANIMALRNQTTSMHLTIAPTMDCCFKCHYCFEEYKEKNYMSSDVMDSVVKYIMSIPTLENLKMTWFGGEPLMAINQMQEFYHKLKEKYKKPIPSNIITTGFHINEEVIAILKKLEIEAVQITLDGMQDSHNKVKHLEECDNVFERVISNIELLNDKAPEINIVIRINLTRHNYHEYVEFVKYASSRFINRHNIAIEPAFVMDRGASNCNRECDSTFFSHKDRSEFVLELANKHKLNSRFINYPVPFFVECAIRNNMAISFDPEGYVYKCWELIGNKKYAVGKINNDGRMTEMNRVNYNRQMYGADVLDNATCSKCNYLPLCSGGCPIQRIENEFEGRDNCNCTHYKGYLEEFMKLHIARKKSQVENQ